MDGEGWRYPHNSCTVRVFSGGDNRGSAFTGDWDPGFYKGECGPGRYVGGVSRGVSGGEPHRLLCCSP